MSELGEVVVIGGGVIGAACAYRLLRSGRPTVWLDAGGASRPASYGNAGHVAIEQTRPLAAPEAIRSAPRRLFAAGGALDFRLGDAASWAPWAARYLAASTPQRADKGSLALGGLLGGAMPAWRRLAADLGAPDLLCEDGHLIVWETAASAKAGLAHWRAADTGQAEVQPLAAAELAPLSQRLGRPLAGAARIARTGQISDPTVMMDALAAACAALGGTRRTARVVRLEPAAGRIRIVLASGETLNPARVVVASGVGSGALLEGLGYSAPIIAERGYHIEGAILAGDHGWASSPPVVFEDRSMIVTRFGDRLRAASFVEFGREASPPDPRKWARLKRHVRELGLPMAEPYTEWMGARPTLPDYLPAIGSGGDGLVYAFGHQHLGLTMAAITGEIVADLIAGRAPPIALSPFDLDRFARGGRPVPTEPAQ